MTAFEKDIVSLVRAALTGEAPTLSPEADYARIDDMDELRMEHVRDLRVDGTLTVENVTKGIRFEVGYDLSELDIETLRAGGTLNLIRAQQ